MGGFRRECPCHGSVALGRPVAFHLRREPVDGHAANAELLGDLRRIELPAAIAFNPSNMLGWASMVSDYSCGASIVHRFRGHVRTPVA